MIFAIFGIEFLSSCFLNSLFFFGLLGYLAVSCGVCDTSIPTDFQDPYGCDHNNQAQSPCESIGFDINPAMSPVFEKGAIESNFDNNVFEEQKEESCWWKYVHFYVISEQILFNFQC
ncbi:unnamed protein product [Caenorhabditis brenneri]